MLHETGDPDPMPAASDDHDLRIACEKSFDFSGPDYACLFEAAATGAFAHPLWLGTFYAMLAPARGAAPVVVTGRQPNGRLVFVLPMILRRVQGIRLLEATDLGVSDYAAPVIDPASRPALAADTTLTARIRAVLPGHDMLRLRPVRPEAVADWRMFLAAEPEPADFSAHAATLTAPYADWRRTAFSRSFQKYLDRRKKRLLKNPAVRLDRLEGPAAAEAVHRLRDLRSGRFDGDPIQTPDVARFYAAIAERGSGAGFCALYRLSEGDTPIAYVFALTTGERLLYLLIGADYDNFGRHSPGLVLYDLMMEDWLARGGRIFDFTIGDEDFKADFGTAPTPMFILTGTPTVLGRAARLVFAIREKLRRLRGVMLRRTVSTKTSET